MNIALLSPRQKRKSWYPFPEDQIKKGTTAPRRTSEEFSIAVTDDISTNEEEYSVSVSSSETGLSPAFEFVTVEGTSASYIDNKVTLLEFAYRSGDARLFLELMDVIDWTNRSVEDFIKTIRFALNLGAHQKARQLAELGGQQFPKNSEMQKYAQILCSSKTIKNQLPTDTDAKADMVWLKEHAKEYRGRWVALRAGALLAAANDYTELLTLLDNPIDIRILITPVY